MIKFISSLALVASIAERAQAATAAELTAYVATQVAISNEWDRAQNCIYTDADNVESPGTDIEYDGGSYGTVKMAFVHIPKSGWALKKYAGVKTWINDRYGQADPGTWDQNKVVVVKDTASPVIKYYDTTKRTCTWVASDDSTSHTFDTIYKNT